MFSKPKKSGNQKLKRDSPKAGTYRNLSQGQISQVYQDTEFNDNKSRRLNQADERNHRMQTFGQQSSRDDEELKGVIRKKSPSIIPKPNKNEEHANISTRNSRSKADIEKYISELKANNLFKDQLKSRGYGLYVRQDQEKFIVEHYEQKIEQIRAEYEGEIQKILTEKDAEINEIRTQIKRIKEGKTTYVESENSMEKKNLEADLEILHFHFCQSQQQAQFFKNLYYRERSTMKN